ncbi:flavin-containing amine-oxidoreductase [Halosimplex carlsbadense 2-9-1]|uniref:Flavin-containing amine-oxidoreductase n=1 Tax=Halosimplex carlsbadense 2-9-1 TaxID=797114 RepID=M0CRN7_9EURY|nr:NAD(P)/FAD-dependent oxidoreductase [Halosimplex carlsbadense]ELZ25042.1 flavin-containing amine-oxidoreductase [Halosimplex carlsbadense 2-9-1]
MSEVVIVGGGLAGLVAARRLARDGADVTLFERRDELGGRVRSREVDGFTLDRGFQVMFTAYPAVREELDLNALDLRTFAPGATIARPDHRSTLADPFRAPLSVIESALNPDVTVTDKIRVLQLRRELGNADPESLLDGPTESIREYLDRKGFSQKFVENFAAPFYGGITLDRSLSTDAGVFRYTFSMLSRGATAVPADGMGAISDQLAARAREAGVSIETGTEITAVDGAAGEATVEAGPETVDADAAVVATDPKRARELTGVESVPTDARGCVTQYFRTREHRSLDTGHRLVLNAVDSYPNTVAPLSTVAPEYAPDGHALLSATTLGVPDRSDEELATAVRDALVTWYPEHRFDDLELLATDRIEFAQFDQPPGFRDGLPAVDAPEGSVYLAGDYTQWSAIQGALESGQVAADTVSDDI